MIHTCSMPDCEKPARGRGLCSAHYERLRKHGDPSVVLKPWHALTVEGRFKNRVAVTDNGCHVWTNGRNSKGYGTMKVNGKSVSAHRLAWEFANGTIPDGLCVLHKCDNPPCCNPDHLFLGTRKDNNDDRDAKGRNINHTGERHGRSVAPDQVIAEAITMKSAGVTLREIQAWLSAQGYTAARSTISTWGRTYRLGTGVPA